MVKCPFCGFDNEDGALFCEQCKSDLSTVAPAAPPPPPPEPEAIPFAPVEEEAPMAAVIEAAPEEIPMAAVEEPAPMAAIMEAAAEVVAEPEPPMAAPIEEPPPAAEMPPPAVPPEPPAPVAMPEPLPAPLPALAPPLDPGPAAPAAAAGKEIPAGSAPMLIVIRGQKLNVEFPIYAGQNFIGRADDKPVDIDLEDQEPPERVWTSRQHAVLEWNDGAGSLVLEDLNSSNGTYVNRVRVHPGQPQQLYLGDVIQIGNIHMRVKV